LLRPGSTAARELEQELELRVGVLRERRACLLVRAVELTAELAALLV